MCDTRRVATPNGNRSATRRAIGRRLALCALCAALTFCARTIRTRPPVSLTVVDEQGAPVPFAHVTLHWWSHPHARLHRTSRFTADGDGRLRLTEKTRVERVMPLCIHGVPEHHYTFCADKRGRGWALADWRPGASKVELALRPNSRGTCRRFRSAYLMRLSGPSRSRAKPAE